jgi:hypothetical protein
MSITYFRFQRAMKAQNVDKYEYLHNPSRFLPYGCYWALFWAPFFLLVQGYSVFLNGNWKTVTFVFNYGIVRGYMASINGRDKADGVRSRWREESGWRSKSSVELRSIEPKMWISTLISTSLMLWTSTMSEKRRASRSMSRTRSWPRSFESTCWSDVVERMKRCKGCEAGYLVIPTNVGSSLYWQSSHLFSSN